MIRGLARRFWSLIGFSRLQTLSIVTFSHGFVAIAFFAQTIVLARILPLSEFGRLATLLSIATIIEAAVAARGSETAMMAFARMAIGNEDDRQHLARTLYRLDLIWSLAIYGALILGFWLLAPFAQDQSSWLLLLIAGSFLGYSWGTSKAYMTVFCGARVFPPVEITYAFITCFVGSTLAWFMGGVGFVIAMMLASLARALLALRQAGLPLSLLWSMRGQSGGRIDRTLVVFGVTGTLRSALLNFASQMDVLFLSATAPSTAVGLYRAAKTMSGLVQRLAQPLWFVLKGHVIAGSGAGLGVNRSRKLIVLTAALFATAGAAVVPATISWAPDIAELAFGAQYRGSAGAIAWLVAGAWTLFAITGWSAMFGSVSQSRTTVILIYLLQIALFGITTLLLGSTPTTVAMALAASQMVTAAAFWLLLSVNRDDKGDTTAAAVPDV